MLGLGDFFRDAGAFVFAGVLALEGALVIDFGADFDRVSLAFFSSSCGLISRPRAGGTSAAVSSVTLTSGCFFVREGL